jgi:pimeloyl-ACP methyl ester carboxylesterase
MTEHRPDSSRTTEEHQHTLVVLLHGSGVESESLNLLQKTTRDAFPSAHIWAPPLPTRRWSLHSPEQIVQLILAGIDEKWLESEQVGRPYNRILLVGHSFGGLLARQTYICACGENADAPLGPLFAKAQRRPWAPAVERIVLLAGINRGWSISHHLSPSKAILWWLGTVVAAGLERVFPVRFLIMQLRRGAPFIVQLRIQWLSMMRHTSRKGCGEALTVQLLGSVDDMVAPEDNLDLVTGRNFVYLDVPFSGHLTILNLDESSEGRARAAVVLRALTRSRDELKEEAVVPNDLMPQPPRDEVTDVIFVIHGIRDEGFWTHKIARKVKARGREKNRVFETETSGYGYFPMLPFLLARGRRRKVEWFMDQYTEDLALYPNADFSFIGHSNGTYLLARALEDYPACRFKHVVFAGSVVRTGYDWDALIDADRVTAVLNYVATADWVVAWFPKALEMLRLQDLGSAGHDGFVAMPSRHGCSSGRCQIKFVQGGHGAALHERHWDTMAYFAVNGELPETALSYVREGRSRLVELIGTAAPVVWLALMALIALGGILIWTADWRESLRMVTLIGYGAAVWAIVTRL